jgi:hypothetical protein
MKAFRARPALHRPGGHRRIPAHDPLPAICRSGTAVARSAGINMPLVLVRVELGGCSPAGSMTLNRLPHPVTFVAASGLVAHRLQRCPGTLFSCVTIAPRSARAARSAPRRR